MIKINENETFTILVQLIDEETKSLAIGETVYYDIREAVDDSSLSPPVEGTLVESTVEPGLYKKTVSVSEDGQYIIYTTCSGFISNSEELVVNSENIYELTKQNRHYNIFPEDVLRTNTTPTASQTIRKVPFGGTDYIINRIKKDDAIDWSESTVASGVIWAWYRNTTDALPYRMAESGV